MAVQRTTYGYRDPHKAMSIKALQDRRAEAEAAFAASGGPMQIASPFQGAANMLDVLGAGLSQKQALRDESEGRAALAQLMSGIKPGEYDAARAAQIGIYDPELANSLRKENLDVLNREDTQAFTTSERLGTQEYQTSDREDRQQADIDAATTKYGRDVEEKKRQELVAEGVAATQHANTVSQSNDHAKVDELLRLGKIDQVEADRQHRHLREMEEANYQQTKPDIYGGMKRAEELNPALKGTPEGQVLMQENLDSSEVKPVLGTPSTKIDIGGEQSKLDQKMDEKEGESWVKMQDARNVAGQQMGDIKLLSELTKIAPQGPIIGNLAQLPVLRNFSSAGAAFTSIVNRVAPTLRVEGSGSTSDLEYNGMLRSLTNLGNYPEANNLILGMMQAKAQINMDRGNAVDAYRNKEIDAPTLRAKLQEINQRSIMTPELQALLDKVGPDELADVDMGDGGITIEEVP